MRTTAACFLATAALAGSTPAATAQPVTGFYMSGGFGAAFPHARQNATPSAPGDAPAPLPGGSAELGGGGVGQGSVGYGFGNGLRFEVEGTGSANRLRLPRSP